MLLIESNSTNPYFNIAAEEYLLKNFDDDIFMLYRNEPSIVVGKHQNTYKEVNYKYAVASELKIARRLSGGGTVYHDLGNLNFTFIANGEQGKFVDFKKYTKPIINFLNELDVPAELGSRNNIFINDKKISGNAEHIFKNRVLHHGTLLFSTDLDKLEIAISGREKSYTDKAVKSVRANVTNICDYLQPQIDISDFQKLLFKNISTHFEEINIYKFTDSDIIKIKKLVDSKYKTWEWNFAYSPKYTLNGTIKTKNECIDFHLKCEDAVIQNLFFSSDNSLFTKISEDIIGKNHDYSIFYAICIVYESELEKLGLSVQKFISFLF